MLSSRSHDASIRRHAQRVLRVSMVSLVLAAPALGRAGEPARPRDQAQPVAADKASDKTSDKTSDKAMAEAAFVRADADRDGKLSKAEASGMAAIAMRFDELDRDKDGMLSMPEYMALYGDAK